jgi:hypothetical protein
MTRQIYAGPIETATEEDCEIPDDWYFVFRVHDQGHINQLLERNERWHRGLLQFPSNVRTRFVISVDVGPHDR